MKLTEKFTTIKIHREQCFENGVMDVVICYPCQSVLIWLNLRERNREFHRNREKLGVPLSVHALFALGPCSNELLVIFDNTESKKT